MDKLNIFKILKVLSMKTNYKIVRTYERTDGRVVCKIVFSITFNVSFLMLKRIVSSWRLFWAQNCLSENAIGDLRIVSKLTLKLNKKAGQGRPASEMPFEWHFVGGPMLVRHCVLAGFIC